MPIRTQESLQKLFEESRLRQQKKQLKLQQQEEKRQHKLNKEREIEAYRKASQSVKKALADKLIKQQKIEQQKAQNQLKIECSRTITIYHTRYIERFIGEDDLYQTRQELEQAMPHCINWTLWDELVNKTRKELEK